MAQASPTQANNYGIGGMPTSRRQLFDNDLIPEESEPIGNQNYMRTNPQQQMVNSPQQQNMRMSSNSSHSFGRPSSRSSSRASPQMSLKNVFGQKKNKSNMDYGDDFDNNDEMDSFGSGPMSEISIKQLSGLRDRDRYPTMGDSPSSIGGGRTMSMTNSFDTTPIIPTFIDGSSNRKNMTNTRNQLMRNDGGFPPQNLYMKPQVGQNFQQFPGGHPHPMSPQRSMSNLGMGPGGMPQDPKYGYNYPKPLGSAGRSMSMGGFARPPPNLTSPKNGPMGGPMNGPMGGPMNGPMGSPMNGPMHGPMHGPGSPANGSLAGPPSIPLNGPEYVNNRTSLPTNNTSPANNESRSRSSSKSSSPSPASNSMSRPNSQALSSYSSPENMSLTSTTPPSKPIVSSSVSVMTESVPTTDRSISPIPVEPLVSTAAVSVPTKQIDSIDRSISPIPFSPVANSFDPATSARSLPQTIQVPVDTLNLIDDLKRRNIGLLDEIRLVTSELADAIRRDIGISSVPKSPQATTDVDQLTMNHEERALFLVNLQNQLDEERRKRLLIEDKLHAINNSIEVEPLYNAISLQSSLATHERNLLAKTIEHDNAKSKLDELQHKYTLLEEDASKLKHGVIPELEAQVEELRSAGEPTELLRSIEELKLENKRLATSIEENANKVVSADKVKDIESQRDALRDALRSLRERKDHEIKQYAERVRMLDGKLEKERIMNSQFQRKFSSTLRSASSPTPGSLTPSFNDSFHLAPPPKGRAFNYKGVRTPELIVKDISSLPKLPRHIAAILKLNQKKKSDSLDDLLVKSSDLAYWAISSGASVLTIYERNGVLKALDPTDFKRRINKKLEQYYGSDMPVIKVNIPPLENSVNNGGESGVFVINLISQEDGRGSLVKLTRELSSRVTEKKLETKEITIPFVDAELTHNEFEEPDLLYVFGRRLDLDGFPPWQIRLSEIFNLEHIDEVSYPLFLRGLESYAGCKINLGS
ncbi:hypothetical protein D0Z00_002032 [Geotrichum galactomycetum]|uniref:Uncharacterized protein n=1 Tax=Geotrichum galactomycetum TaxID=27317 RepID=A0ACB6V5D2_9ASCO|nr:hypothetical protein D0Z00_002032 [Geotrichum candidum]